MDFLRTTLDGSQSSASELSSVESESEDPLVQLAKEVKQQPFTTRTSLQKVLEHRHRALYQDQTRDQYLVFTSVPPAQYSKLSDERLRISKFCRFSLNTETGIVIVKVTANPAHELAIGAFDSLVFLELLVMNVDDETLPCGSATVTVGNWQKEANSSCCPTGTDVRLSFVVEVGLSESARQLALDARGWLETDSSSVKLVVTITIHQDNPTIILHRWELLPRRSGVVTRSAPLLARRTAFLKLFRTNNTTSIAGESYMNGTTTNITQLTLPFDKILNRPPHRPLERDLVIPEQKLRHFAENIWRVQGLL
ncbi:hypothetical protein BJX63DRAFT_376029 [Aspergillus granulosus]|uniref:Uncharacterized protein n=1 Tax=Aspergillus granulosus TaxID=176169 RepID=A0ABR4I5S5_9EURO